MIYLGMWGPSTLAPPIVINIHSDTGSDKGSPRRVRVREGRGVVVVGIHIS